MAENITYMSDLYKFNENDYKIVEKITAIMESLNQINCTSCGYCLDVCPKKYPLMIFFSY